VGERRVEVRSDPLVSIVTPGRNQGAFLEATLKSVLEQDYPAIEYVVIDGASSDGSPEIIRRYSDRLAYWVSEPDRGQSDAINKGWGHCTGEIFAWLNSDDLLLPGAVASAMRVLDAHPEVGVVYGDTHFIDAAGAPAGTPPPRRDFEFERVLIGAENPIAQPSAFIRRRVLDEVGFLDPSLHYFMDWDLWLRIGARYPVMHVPELWSSYRLHPESKTVSRDHLSRMAEELERMYETFFASGRVPAELLGRREEAFANVRFTAANYALEGGSPGDARRLAARAVRDYPALLARPAMARKLAYCFLRDTPLYRAARAARGIASRP
jgi:glycosyltransferase involved in cell wall biosynthesis